MIKKLFILIVFIVFSKLAVAQPGDGQYEISGSIGLISGRYVGDMLTFTDKESQMEDYAETPNYFISNKYFINDRVALGLTFGVQTITGYSNEDASSSYPYSFKRVDITFAPEITFIYITRHWFQFYSLYGIGIDPYTEHINYYNAAPESRNTGAYFTKQITPLGLRFGGDFAVYLEFGIGYKGLMNTGLSYTLGKPRRSKWWK